MCWTAQDDLKLLGVYN